MKGGKKPCVKCTGLLNFMLFINILLGYLIFCTALFLVTELLLHMFKDRILKNGWSNTEAFRDFQKKEANNYSLLEYCLPMYIPGVNLLCAYDILMLIIKRAE